MRTLERKGHLDRVVEFLPDSAAMRARAQNRQHLTRPSCPVLLAYASRSNDEILRSDLPDDPLLEASLRYFQARCRRSMSRRSAPTGCAAKSRPSRS